MSLPAKIDGPSELNKADAPDVDAFWREEIDRSKQHLKNWLTMAKRLKERYAAEHNANDNAKDGSVGDFNIFYSNVETLRPAVFQHMPKPMAHRRVLKRDPVGLAAAQLLENIVTHQLDEQSAKRQVNYAIYDMLITGRGVLRLAYEFEQGETTPGERMPVQAAPGPLGMQYVAQAADGSMLAVPMDQIQRDPAGGALYWQAPEEPSVGYEWVQWAHVPYDHFLHSPAERWEDVTWVAFKSEPTKAQAKRFFGDETAERMQYGKPDATSWGGNSMTSEDMHAREQYDRAEVWEIWDKATASVFYIDANAHQTRGGGGRVLKKLDDPLKLRGFFPMPPPLDSFSGRSGMRPRPEWAAYREQAQELDYLSRRLRHLIRALQIRILTPASEAEQIRNALFADAGDKPIVNSIENWGAINAAGGIERMIWFMPIDVIVQAINQVLQAREAVKQEVFEITGISDILRGTSKASETATAQNIKRQFATLRIDERVRYINEWLAAGIQINAEIIAEHFSPQTIVEASGVDLNPQIAGEVIKLLRDDVRRRFRLDIETDSTQEPDQLEAQQQNIQMVSAITQAVSAMAPMVQAGVFPFELAKQILMLTVRPFPGSRPIQEALEQLQPPPPPPQEPSDAEVKMAIEDKRAETQTQITAMKSAAQTQDAREAHAHDQQMKRLEVAAQAMAQAVQAVAA